MSAYDYSPLKTALNKLTVPDVWEMLGLPGIPKASCRSPLRDNDHNASFSIYDDNHRWKDHGTGEGGDAADFCAAALGLSKEDGARRLIEMARTGREDAQRDSHKTTRCDCSQRDKYDPFKDPEKSRKRQRWPAFEVPSQAEIEAVAVLRGLSPQSVTLAAEQGLLFCASLPEGRAWVVTDSRRVNAQARRLDGKPWEHNGKKAWSLSGSIGTWPIGLREAATFPAIALVEGAPDLLAALHLAWSVDREQLIAPVAILGASNVIPDAALPFFVGKHVRLFPHVDTGGQQAGKKWGKQLHSHCLIVDVYLFEGLTRIDGSPVGDLNDFVHICHDQWEDLAEEAVDFGSPPLPNKPASTTGWCP
jgi:hypothetical protein